MVEFPLYGFQLLITDLVEISTFRKVVPQPQVRILIASPLIGRVRISKVGGNERSQLSVIDVL